MKEGFRPIDDILSEIGEEEGMSLEEMKDIWNHQRKYTQKQMDTEGVYSIFLPFIGTLSLNVKQFDKEVKGKTRSLYQGFIDKVTNLKEHENYTKYGNSHKRVTGVNRLARYIITNYDTGLDRSKNILIHNKCWDIISKYSNGVFEKRDETLKRTKNTND